MNKLEEKENNKKIKRRPPFLLEILLEFYWKI